MFDLYYISAFNILKPSIGKRAIRIALYYTCFVELTFYVLLAAFFAAFTSQMGIRVLPVSKVYIVFILIFIGVYFKNWMRYSGKRRHILNAKSKHRILALWKLIAVPLICVLLAVIFLQAIT